MNGCQARASLTRFHPLGRKQVGCLHFYMSRLFLAVVVNLCSGARSKAIKWGRSCRNDKPQGVKIQQSGSVLGGGGGGGGGYGYAYSCCCCSELDADMVGSVA